jgi:hypothetical protein
MPYAIAGIRRRETVVGLTGGPDNSFVRVAGGDRKRAIAVSRKNSVILGKVEGSASMDKRI